MSACLQWLHCSRMLQLRNTLYCQLLLTTGSKEVVCSCLQLQLRSYAWQPGSLASVLPQVTPELDPASSSLHHHKQA